MGAAGLGPANHPPPATLRHVRAALAFRRVARGCVQQRDHGEPEGEGERVRAASFMLLSPRELLRENASTEPTRGLAASYSAGKGSRPLRKSAPGGIMGLQVFRGRRDSCVRARIRRLGTFSAQP